MIRKIGRFLHPRFQTLFLDYPVRFKPRYGHGLPAHPGLRDLVNAERGAYAQRLEKALSNSEPLLQIKWKGKNENSLPVWDNGYFPGLDMLMLFGMMNEIRPAKYLEIGSGNSTKMAGFARKEFSLPTHIISIDPQPRAEIDSIADEVFREAFEDCSVDIPSVLGKGDILFIDNSHRILPNSDSMVFFLEVLPRLKPGVVVHIHDIYWPYDYPQFMCERFYSEQYGLGIALLSNPSKYQVLMPNYFVSEDKDLAGIVSPFWEKLSQKGIHPERHGGSFWMLIRE